MILIGGLPDTPTLTTATQRLKDTFPEIMWPKRIPLSLMSKILVFVEMCSHAVLT